MSEARPGPSSGARRVFISSTNEDLKPHYRAAARDAALEAGFYPTMQEYFVASGEHPPLAACLKKLADADVDTAGNLSCSHSPFGPVYESATTRPCGEKWRSFQRAA